MQKSKVRTSVKVDFNRMWVTLVGPLDGGEEEYDNRAERESESSPPWCPVRNVLGGSGTWKSRKRWDGQGGAGTSTLRCFNICDAQMRHATAELSNQSRRSRTRSLGVYLGK